MRHVRLLKAGAKLSFKIQSSTSQPSPKTMATSRLSKVSILKSAPVRCSGFSVRTAGQNHDRSRFWKDCVPAAEAPSPSWDSTPARRASSSRIASASACNRPICQKNKVREAINLFRDYTQTVDGDALLKRLCRGEAQTPLGGHAPGCVT